MDDDAISPFSDLGDLTALGRILERFLATEDAYRNLICGLDWDGADDLVLDGSIPLDATEADVVRRVLRRAQDGGKRE